MLGDQRGAAVSDFDGDARVDLAVSQNGARMTLWRNTQGVPGVRVHLSGPAGNPLGLGAQLRILSGSVRGPVREVHAGSGYWSMDGATTILATPPGVTAVSVRWPGGKETVISLTAGQRDVLIRAPANGARSNGAR